MTTRREPPPSLEQLATGAKGRSGAGLLGRRDVLGNTGRDVARAVSREHNRVTAGAALTDHQKHKMMARAQTAKARVVHTELFWVMMELVAMESAGTILQMLKEAADDIDPNHHCTVCSVDGASCSGTTHCQGCRGCVRRTRFCQPHKPGCSPGVCECSEHPPAWPHDPISGPKYAALRPGFAACGANLVDQQFGWNIGMHAAAQGKVQTLRMLLGIRGWNNREQSVLSSTKPEVSGWHPREPAVHPLTDETYKIKKTSVFPASIGPEGGAPEEGLTSYPLDLSVRSRELRPTTHKFWWKAGADAGSGRSLRKPDKAVELLLEEAYGECDADDGAANQSSSGTLLCLPRMPCVIM